MNANNIARLFISRYSQSGCKWVLDGANKLNEKDFVLFLDDGEEVPNERVKVLVENFKKKGNAEILSVEALINNEDNHDLKRFIVNKIKNYTTWDTVVAFMCWADMYDELESEINPIVEEHGSYKNVKYVKRKQRREPLHHESDDNVATQLASNICDALSSINEDGSVSSSKETSNEVYDIEDENGYEDTVDNNKKTPKRISPRYSKSQNESDNEEKHNEEKPTSSGASKARKEVPKLQKPSNNKKGGKGKKDNDEPEDDECIEDIEARIFLKTKDKQEVERNMSELSMAKAGYVDSLYQRLVEGIKIYIDKDSREKLDNSQFLEFIMILLSVETYNEFLDNWNVVGDKNFPIVLSDEAFSYLREEALYYSSVCEMVYEKDKWA